MEIQDDHIVRAKEIYKNLLNHKDLRSLPKNDKKFVAFIASVLSQKQNNAFAYSNNSFFHPNMQVPMNNASSHMLSHSSYPHSVVHGGFDSNHGNIRTPFITLNAQWFFDDKPDFKLSEANRILKSLHKDWRVKEYYIDGVKSLFSGKLKVSKDQFENLKTDGCVVLIYKNSKNQFLRVEIVLQEGARDEERPSMNFSFTSYYPEFNQNIHSLEHDFLDNARNSFVGILNKMKATIKDGAWIPEDVEICEAADWNGSIDCSHLSD